MKKDRIAARIELAIKTSTISFYLILGLFSLIAYSEKRQEIQRLFRSSLKKQVFLAGTFGRHFWQALLAGILAGIFISLIRSS
ncbi:MAG: hypothetical protein FWE54_00860 [Methanimicrococcus sp.]|nr:hypothetical protein [Methanimicrococcus sp.]